MIRLLTAVLLFASFNVMAEVTLTNINNNDVADADEVMGNFNALKQGVEANATAIEGLIEPNQLCGTGFSCLSGTFDYRYGSDAEAEWWGRPNANSNCGFGATGVFLYLLDSKWVLGTGLGGSSGVIATCNAAAFVNHPTQCGSNWEDANGPIEASFSSGSCGEQKLSDLNCGDDEIIKREGSAWVCAADPLANLGSCKNGEALVYVDGSVTCDCNPPGTVITDSNFTSAITDWLAKGDASQYGDIAKWCTGSVTDMGHAFASEHTFNADISGWDTSNVTYMNSMFEQAWEFNQDLSSWDASSVSSCLDFAFAAYAWAAAYDSIAGKTPPLSASLIAAGCGE